MVQKHDARNLHYDFRLELDGTLKSWAVPKGPSLDPSVKRMAVEVEDHPLAYGGFEGTIPEGQYGAGSVIVWDRGTWQPAGDAQAGLRDGKLEFELHGDKLAGAWTLVRMKPRPRERQPTWLLMKKKDDHARPEGEYDVTAELPDSVLTPPRGAAPSRRRVAAATAPSAAGAATSPAKARTAARKAPAAGKASAAGKAPAAKKSPAATKAPATKKKAAPIAAETAPATENAATARKPAKPAAKAASAARGAAPPLPETISPQLATLVDQPPADDGWLYEAKFDGYRLLARIERGEARCITRSGKDWTAKLPQLAAALAALPVESAWIDGEIVVGEGGDGDFQALQNAFDAIKSDAAAGRTNDLVHCYLFDLPWLDGVDLRERPLVERRAALERIVAARPHPQLHFSVALEGDVAQLLEAARQGGLEGLIGKRADSPYVPRRSADWIKLKVQRRQEFVIGGWTDPNGSRQSLGSLLLGVQDDEGRLRYAGNVGTGFTAETLAELAKRLEPLAAAKSPFADAPATVGTVRKARPHWVRPELVAEVSFAQWTRTGRLRQAVFHGLRDDKPAADVRREQAVKPPAGDAGEATAAAGKAEAAKKPTARKALAKRPEAGKQAASAPDRPALSAITHPERVVDASSGITKGQLAAYYDAAAALMLPHLAGRPLSLLRAPAGIDGKTFFQRHADGRALPGVELLDAPDGMADGQLLSISTHWALLSAAQMNAVEFHTWNATAPDLARPDRMVFDLDPGEGVAFGQLREAAALLRAFLDELGLAAWLKTSGGKGLHVVVPHAARHGWDATKDFSKAIVEHVADVLPGKFVARSGAEHRKGRIFIDYLRNGLGASTVCAWSARARAGLGVSVPVGWSELDGLTAGAQWTVANIAERLDVGNAPWDGYPGKQRQSLARAMKKLRFDPAAPAR